MEVKSLRHFEYKMEKQAMNMAKKIWEVRYGEQRSRDGKCRA